MENGTGAEALFVNSFELSSRTCRDGLLLGTLCGLEAKVVCNPYSVLKLATPIATRALPHIRVSCLMRANGVDFAMRLITTVQKAGSSTSR